MTGDITSMFSSMIGTLAVILLVSAFIGGSDIISKLLKTEKKWKYIAVMGVMGGIFGIYGNISGFDLNGAVISVRDIGPMLAGFTGGPLAGLLAGLIAGIHRLTMGGITAQACVVATCIIGLISGAVSDKWHILMGRPLFAVLFSALMEVFHLCVVLIMVKPFETALDIVKQIAVPFIAVNALGFMLMIAIITYIERQRAIALEKSRLQSELEVANVIQHSLLPSINDEYPGCSDTDVSAMMEAAKEVGGDFYDLFHVGQDRIAFVIGDVSGKGIPAALFMALSKTVLQNCIRDIPDLSKAVETANNSLCARNDADMFVTVWAGVLDRASGQLEYVSAGHNPPVLIRNGGAELLRTKNGFVLAGMEDMRYKAQSIQLETGDTVYLYTDGVTEAENRFHELFGEERLLNCFGSDSCGSPAEIINDVRKSIEGFIDGNSQFDDITMLCFKWTKRS